MNAIAQFMGTFAVTVLAIAASIVIAGLTVLFVIWCIGAMIELRDEVKNLLK